MLDSHIRENLVITHIKRLFLAVLLCASFSAFALDLIQMKQGVNSADLNGDGRVDYFFLAQYDNNKSHPSKTITFYIQKPEGGYSIMPSIVQHEFTYFSLSLSGSNIAVSDFSLVRDKEKFYFVTSDKISINAYDKQTFNFTLYQFVENEDNPGASLYSWEKTAEATSSSKYISAIDSFKELELHFSTAEKN